MADVLLFDGRSAQNICGGGKGMSINALTKIRIYEGSRDKCIINYEFTQ